MTARKPDAARRDRLVFLPMIVVAALLAAGNEDFGFDAAGWLDSFMYFGYFWHYPAHLPGLDHDYKASRLPWTLAGYAAHALGVPAAASYVLVFATLSAGGIALYALVRDITENRTAASVTSLAWTSCTWAHGVGGWNYHMLAAADYFLLASWLAFRAARAESRWAAVLAGASAAAAVHTHLFFASFLPLLGLTYWSALRVPAGSQPRVVARAAITDGVRAVAGAVVLTLALAALNVATGGEWFFFMPQVERARMLMRHDDWWEEAVVWIPRAGYLVAPMAFMLGGLAVLERSHAAHRHRPATVAVLQAWLALGLMCIAQFVRHQATLNRDSFAFPLYVYAFPCIGVLLAGARSGRRQLLLVLASVGAVLGPLLLLMPAPLPHLMNTAATELIGTNVLPVLPPLAFALLGAGITSAIRSPARVVAFAVWFGVLNAWIAPAPSAYGLHTPGYRRQMLELFAEADGMTTAFDPRLDGIKYYWSTDVPLSTASGDIRFGQVFDSFVSTRGSWQGNRLTQERTVPVQQLTLEDLQTAMCVGVLSPPQASGQLEHDLKSHFESLGMPLRRLTVRHLARPALAFDLTLLIPGDAPVRRGPPCLRR